MTRRMTSSIVLTLSLLISLVSFATTAQGQQRFKPVFDTGPITLGFNQVLRLFLSKDRGETIAVRFGKAAYMPLGCNGDGVCKYSLASESLSTPVILNLGEAASMDITLANNNYAVRGTVLSNDPNVRVNAVIIDGNTGNIIAVLGSSFGAN